MESGREDHSLRGELLPIDKTRQEDGVKARFDRRQLHTLISSTLGQSRSCTVGWAFCMQKVWSSVPAITTEGSRLASAGNNHSLRVHTESRFQQEQTIVSKKDQWSDSV